MAISNFEAGTTIQFTFTSSVAPDSAPTLGLTDNTGTVIDSGTALQSGSTQYYRLVTLPSSNNVYVVGEWEAKKTLNSTEYPFIKRFEFKITERGAKS